MGFWERVFELREQGLIPRVWKRRDIEEFLRGEFAPNTINALPSNYSVLMEGDEVGNSVKRGQSPKAWRVGRGKFQLIADPEDDVPTQKAEKSRAKRLADQIVMLGELPPVVHAPGLTHGEPGTQERKGNDHRDEAPTSAPDSPDQPGPQAGSVPSSPELYPSIPVALTPSDRQTLTDRSTEQKALYIVHKHLIDKYGDRVDVQEDRDGANLRVSVDGKSERIEVKGTERPTLAWSQLKVSSRKSHDVLASGEASMYHVVDVDGTTPLIYVLNYGRHFTLEPEPRWAVKRVPPKNHRYPLRGEPYRYDLPYDPVATDDWEVRG